MKRTADEYTLSEIVYLSRLYGDAQAQWHVAESYKFMTRYLKEEREQTKALLSKQEIDKREKENRENLPRRLKKKRVIPFVL